MPPDESQPTRVERPSAPSRPDREPTPTPAPRPAGVARYENGAEIARGGMGRVVEATDHVLGRVVAVKEALTDDPDTLKRFARETRITARLEHPSIVPLYDAGGGQDGVPPYYVMRRVTGKPLADLVEAADSLDKRLALLPHMIACAQAIAHAHMRGVIHRDLKPTNILVGELGETVVIDWGLAKVVGEVDEIESGPSPLAGDSLRTRIGTVAGTPGFMAPEQARGDTHGMRADVWALGACLYYVLARRPPHATPETSGDDLVALTAARPVPPLATFVRGVPAELAAIVDTALAFAEDDRYRDAAALAEDLQRFQAGQLVASHDYTLGERLRRWAKKNRALVATLGVAIVVIAAVSTISITRVVDARDRAEVARRGAEAESRRAEAERKRADDRADAELLGRARTAVATEPARAAAIVKLLPPTSSRLGEGLAVVRSARMAGGSVWAVRGGDDIPTHTEISPDGTRAFVLRRDGTLEVFDLDHPEKVSTFQRSIGERPDWWPDSHRILITQGTEAELLDTTTGALDSLALGRLEQVVLDSNGSAVALTDIGYARVDIAARTKKAIALPFAATSVALSQDGTCVAAADSDRVALLDRQDRVLATFTARQPAVVPGPGTRFAVVSEFRVWEVDCNVAPPSFVERRLVTGSGATLGKALSAFYGGERLYASLAGGLAELSLTAAASLYESKTFRVGTKPVGPAQIAALINDREVILTDGTHQRRLRLPTAVTYPRLAGRRGVNHLVVAARGQSLVFDLRAVLPRMLIERQQFWGAYMTNDTIASGNGWGFDWLDVATGKATPATMNGQPCCAEMQMLVRSRPALLIAAPSPDHPVVYGYDTPYKDGVAFRGRHTRVAVDEYTVFSRDRELYVGKLREHPRHVATMSTLITDVRSRGNTFTVVTADEVALGDAAAGTITKRVPFPKGTDNVVVGVWNQRVLVARDTKLTWIDTAEEVATVDRPVAGIFDVEGGLLLALHGDSGVLYLRLDNGPPSLQPIGMALLTTNSRFALIGSIDGIAWVDFPSLAKSQMPISGVGDPIIDISPDGRQLLEVLNNRWWLWDLPQLQGDMFAAARETTNLVELPHAVVWPWQAP